MSDPIIGRLSAYLDGGAAQIVVDKLDVSVHYCVIAKSVRVPRSAPSSKKRLKLTTADLPTSAAIQP